MRFSALKALLPAMALALTSALPAEASGIRDNSFTPRTVTGNVTLVRHADEITVGNLPVRLEGIAAPRLGKPLGAQAVHHMNRIAFGERVSCRLTGERFRNAEVGTCRASGQDLARSLIRAGLARSCLKIGLRRYTFHEARAKQTGIVEVFPLPRFCGPDPAHPNRDTQE